jgi:hypothetical protein
VRSVSWLARIRGLVSRAKQYVSELYNYYVPPFRVNTVMLTESELLSVINDIYRKTFVNARWFRLDKNYYTTGYETFRRLIEWDWTDTREYLKDVFDCDDFAIYFKSRMAIEFNINAIAVVLDYSSAHAYNIVILKDCAGVRWYIYEPQTDELIEFEKRNTKYYAMRDYVIIL